jgi:hypothetical protein
MTGYMEKGHASSEARRRAVDNHRRRLRARGIDRFEVRGLETDKALLREIARRLALGDDISAKLRAKIVASVDSSVPERGGILRALRRSPMVGAGLDLERQVAPDRNVDL